MIPVLFVLAIQLVIWGVLARGLRRARQADAPFTGESGGPLPPITVIVAARNEALIIDHLLDHLAGQRYPEFEIILVDNASTDDTGDRARTHVDVRVLTCPQGGKKAALAAGIREARYEFLAFTDADCRPGPQWLRCIGSRHAALRGHRLIAGWAPLRAEKNGLGRFQRYDALLNQVVGAAGAGNGWSYMATGRNLSYDRALFQEVGGFDRHRDLLSGDDDLFVQEVGSRATFLWMDDPQSMVPSPARVTFWSWVRQKRRHSSAGTRFRKDVQILFLVHHVTNLALWTAPLWAGGPGVVALVVRLLIQMAILGPVFRRLGESDLIFRIPWLAFWNAVYSLTVPVLGLMKAPDQWQQRT